MSSSVQAATISKCPNGHYFITAKCHICGSKAVEFYERRQGDCVDCGALCPGYAYACTSPMPIEIYIDSPQKTLESE